jgi:hypothetical protein
MYTNHIYQVVCDTKIVQNSYTVHLITLLSIFGGFLPSFIHL